MHTDTAGRSQREDADAHGVPTTPQRSDAQRAPAFGPRTQGWKLIDRDRPAWASRPARG